MDKEQKTIMQFYAAFAAAVVFNFVPLAVAQLFGVCLILAVMIGAYIYRARAKLDSLAYNHMTYLIGTIWVSSFMLVIGLAVATYWVYAQGDHSLIEPFIADMSSGTVDAARLESAMHDYIRANMKLLITATLATMAPGVLYLVYRTAVGITRAGRGYRIAKPAAWF